MRRKKDTVAAASKTYRKVNKLLSKAVGVRVVHSKYPSDDFQNLLDQVDENMKTMALNWYERGIKRGISFATDCVLDGTIVKSRGSITAPNILPVKVRTRFKDENWHRRTFKIKAEDVGFK